MGPLNIIVSSETFGDGKEELGRLLMANFLKALGSDDELPSAMFLINRGVFLATGSSHAVEFLGDLQKAGVTILLCQTCVEYYGISNEVALGEISKMSKLAEMVTAGRTVHI